MGSKPSFSLKFIAAYVLQFLSLISDSLGSVHWFEAFPTTRTSIVPITRKYVQLSEHPSIINKIRLGLFNMIDFDFYLFLKEQWWR